MREARAVGAAQRATQSTNTSLRDLLRKCEEIVAVLDEASRELDDIEAMLRRCSWRLTSLRGEAVKVEEVGGVPLNGVPWTRPLTCLARPLPGS